MKISLAMPVFDNQFAIAVGMIGLVLMTLALFTLRQSAFYRGLVDREAASNRFHAIDGLRGYLALGVLFHHLAVNYQFYQTGEWGNPPPGLSTMSGRGAVAFFFMITALLFWGRVVDSGERFDAIKFYVSRFRRMIPMYVVSVVLVVLTVIVLTDFHQNVTSKVFFQQVVEWLLFTIPGVPDINGLDKTYLINTVFWSLVFEWKFYLLLPLMAVFSRGRLQWLLLVLAGICIWTLSTLKVEWFFFAGCLASNLIRVPRVRNFALSPAGTALAVISLCATYAFKPWVYDAAGAALLLFPFIAIASGNSFFGVLTCRPARLLGLLSYSIYVIHNWLIYVVCRLVDPYFHVDTLSPSAYWLLGGAISVAAVLVSILTYRFVEYPFIRPSSSQKSNVEAAGAVG
ncbi:acyltransferase [Paraburkholderia sp. D15]|uniref:acyltransferase family protein n=1 Tax=Paraburkholderia sp. D15 TaxID=2880218 RepID=UPI002478A272|nr:acyltransferase [Paraburkholderia sp. D15]WGS52661.1 acyltransferase [Paraburkholderia sp. D15]